jgi:hypothetical protein
MEGRTMMLEITDKGVVTIRYQDDMNYKEAATVTVTPNGNGEGVRVELHRVGQEDRTMNLTYYDTLALTAALAATEVPPPPRG